MNDDLAAAAAAVADAFVAHQAEVVVLMDGRNRYDPAIQLRVQQAWAKVCEAGNAYAVAKANDPGETQCGVCAAFTSAAEKFCPYCGNIKSDAERPF